MSDDINRDFSLNIKLAVLSKSRIMIDYVSFNFTPMCAVNDELEFHKQRTA